MSIEEVATIIGKISDGLEATCIKCIQDNAGEILQAVQDQLWSGRDGDGEYLEPNYDNDDFFQEEGRWKGRAKEYKEWKLKITKPSVACTFLDKRPDNIPNLYITGKFYGEIYTYPIPQGLLIDPGTTIGIDIVEKYGEQILKLSPQGVGYFNDQRLRPALREFFKSCGYVK